MPCVRAQNNTGYYRIQLSDAVCSMLYSSPDMTVHDEQAQYRFRGRD